MSIFDIDMFAPIAEQEQAVANSYESRITALQNSIAVFDAIQSLKGAAGYQEFRRAIEKIAAEQLKLLTSVTVELTDSRIRELLGSYRTTQSILKMFDGNAEHLKRLAEDLKRVENEYRTKFTESGRPRPSSIGDLR